VLALVTNQPPQHFVSGCTFATGTTTKSGTPTYYALTPDQAQNASVIAAVGIQKGLPDHAVTVALATAFQESQLENLNYGDLDSVGLFQQRPSQGWGTPAQVTDPTYASDAFLNALHQYQASNPGWATQPLWQAAQGVQNSGFPYAYAKWEIQAAQVVANAARHLF